MTHTIDIKPYNSIYVQQIVDLILTIQQQEFGLPIALNDQPDLLKIDQFCQVNHGNF